MLGDCGMKILCLYNNNCALKLFDWLQQKGNECILWDKRLDAVWCRSQNIDLAVSYTYSFILKEDVLEALKFNVVNLHTSLLPWNRGVDPNMWSIIEGTPRGVTLHYMDSRVDKGAVIAQELSSAVDIQKDTLKTSYDQLDELAVALFKKAFQYYDYWSEMKKQVLGAGTYHTDQQGIELRKFSGDFTITVEEFLERIKENRK